MRLSHKLANAEYTLNDAAFEMLEPQSVLSLRTRRALAQRWCKGEQDYCHVIVDICGHGQHVRIGSN